MENVSRKRNEGNEEVREERLMLKTNQEPQHADSETKNKRWMRRIKITL